MPRRLLVFWIVLASVLVFVREVVFFVPLFRGGFLLVLNLCLFCFRVIEQLFDQFSLFCKAIQILFRQKLRLSLRRLSRRKRRVHPVIILRRNRIELVVVTFAATHRHGEKSLADIVNQIVQVDLTRLFLRNHLSSPRAHSKQACCDQSFRFVGAKFIARDLLHREFVEWLVLIERPNDVVPVTPGVGPFVVVRKTSGVGITNDVEPMLSLTLAVVLTTQQPIDEIAPGFFRIVRRSNFVSRILVKCRRQTGQVVRGPAEQCAGMSFFRRSEAGFTEAFHDESINWVRRSSRNFRPFDRLKRPEIFFLVAAVRPVVSQTSAGINDQTILILTNGPFLLLDFQLLLSIWPRSTGGDPFAKVLGLFFR